MAQQTHSRTATPTGEAPPVWSFGPFRFDGANGILSRDGDDLYLPPRAVAVLGLLLERAGDVVSKDELVTEVWGDISVTDQSPSEAVGVIREVLEDDSHAPVYIQTVYRRGYRFIAPVEVHSRQPAPEPAAPFPYTVAQRPGRVRPGWAGLIRWGLRPAGWILLGLVAGLGAAVLMALRADDPPSPMPSLRLPVSLSHPLVPSNPPALAISPVGRHLVYRADKEGRQELYLQSLDRFEGRWIPGSEGGFGPFFSPDGQWVGYFRDRSILKVSVRGGPPTVVAATTQGRVAGAAWSRGGTIVFSGGARAALWTVPASGGVPERLAAPRGEQGEYAYVWPSLLPDESGVVFAIQPVGMKSTDDFDLAVATLPGGEVHPLAGASGSQPWHLATGELGFVRGGALFAAPFDSDELRITGPAVPIVEDPLAVGGVAQLAMSPAGAIAYVPGGDPLSYLAWFRRDGSRAALALEPGHYGRHRLSPDGRRIALGIGGDIWQYDLERGAAGRLTTHASDEITPLWRPDGGAIVFGSNRTGPYDLYERSTDGASVETCIVETPYSKFPETWSPDGRWIVYTEVHPETGLDLWLLDVESRERRPLVRTRFDESQARISPDGRWITYVTDEPGHYEVVVQAFPGPGPTVQISSSGARSPAWSPAGDEIFFNTGDRILRVEIRDFEPFTVTRPTELFQARNTTSFFTVDREAHRFLVGISSVPEQFERVHLIMDGARLIPPAGAAR